MAADLVQPQWRNLSVPQRAVLRHLRDRGTAAVGNYRSDCSYRCAYALVGKGLAAWSERGSRLQVTAAGLEVVRDR